MSIIRTFINYLWTSNSHRSYSGILDREQLWTILNIFGIPDKSVKLIQICNKQSCYRVRFSEELSSLFECKNGLRQDDTMFTVLFNLALEKVVRHITDLREIEIIGPYTLLVYTDDIISLGESRKDLEKSTRKLIISSCIMGLVINKNKTKYMVITKNTTIRDNY